MQNKRILLTVSCPDRVGIVAAVAGFLAQRSCFIEESSHFGDTTTGRFFMRTLFELSSEQSQERLAAEFQPLRDEFAMEARFFAAEAKTRTLIMVSRLEHCLFDLLHHMRVGSLAIDVPLVVSNHESLRGLVEWHGVRYHYLPVTAATRDEQEAKLRVLCEQERIELLVLARYMQILSAEFLQGYEGRIINIHHSFLPSFKGARPYAQAYARGVKLIGATAHYVTPHLDEGPIIAQDVEHVTHASDVDDLTSRGRDIERRVLTRAIQAHVEHRVLLNDEKTVVF